ncbi:SAF domain-containing protein [Pseudonocardia sediminis]|uniref:SAF domain-containing protein n=1 Tax=Pseudonocardia sediminis TaxID=1397368 RepID=UPI001028F19C|nr:SAF domain-containing protein [Pseudonocardia sediminis]
MVLAIIGALLGAYAYRAAVSRDGVVGVAQPLAFGATVRISDLREVQLPSDTGLATVPWSEVDSVVGKLTSTDLRAGQVLTPDSVTGERLPAPGEAVVGLSVESGRAPSESLGPRDEVLVVTGGGRPPRRAVVVRSGDSDATGRRGIDVLVRQADAEELALASVDDRVAVVLVGRR